MPEIPAPHGRRHDGSPKSGVGFLGPLKRKDGGISTELSIGVEIDGEEIEIPALVPTLTKPEIKYLLNDFNPETDRMPAHIVRKAQKHALDRKRRGLSPFAD